MDIVHALLERPALPTAERDRWQRDRGLLQVADKARAARRERGTARSPGCARATGTYPITGAELDPATCGVCVRGLGDKGSATQKEYFATGGQVQVTAVGGGGAPVSVTLMNGTFVEINAAKAAVPMGCTASVMRAQLAGTIMGRRRR